MANSSQEQKDADRWQMMREFREELFKIMGRELPYAENPYNNGPRKSKSEVSQNG